MSDSTFEQRCQTTAQLLREACTEQGITLAGDGSIVEAHAEALLGYSVGTLRRQREEGTCRIPRRRIGNRWRYRLSDIAVEFERNYFE